MNITVGTKYYYKGFAAPFQVYEITRVEVINNNAYASTRLHTTESSAGVNNEMYKWFNLTDFQAMLKRGQIFIKE